MGHMGNVVWGIRYRGMGHMANRAHGQWGTGEHGVWGTWARLMSSSSEADAITMGVLC